MSFLRVCLITELHFLSSNFESLILYLIKIIKFIPS